MTTPTKMKICKLLAVSIKMARSIFKRTENHLFGTILQSAQAIRAVNWTRIKIKIHGEIRDAKPSLTCRATWACPIVKYKLSFRDDFRKPFEQFSHLFEQVIKPFEWFIHRFKRLMKPIALFFSSVQMVNQTVWMIYSSVQTVNHTIRMIYSSVQTVNQTVRTIYQYVWTVYQSVR